MSYFLPAVPLAADPVDCTSWGAGHHIHPIQVKLAFTDEGPRGRLLRTPDGLVFETYEGAAESVASHCNDTIHEALDLLGPDGWCLSHSLLFKDRFGASVANGFPLGLCTPRRARNPKKVFRVGVPRSGGPVRRQRWVCSILWGSGTCLDGTQGWTGGLAAKLHDLATRGPHLLRISALDGSRGWLVHVNAPALTLYEAGSGLLHLTVDDADDVAARIRARLGDDFRLVLEVEVTSAPELDLDELFGRSDEPGGIACSLDGSLVAERPQAVDDDDGPDGDDAEST